MPRRSLTETIAMETEAKVRAAYPDAACRFDAKRDAYIVTAGGQEHHGFMRSVAWSRALRALEARQDAASEKEG